MLVVILGKLLLLVFVMSKKGDENGQEEVVETRPLPRAEARKECGERVLNWVAEARRRGFEYQWEALGSSAEPFSTNKNEGLYRVLTGSKIRFRQAGSDWHTGHYACYWAKDTKDFEGLQVELASPPEPLEPRATRWRREYPEMFEVCDRAIEAGVALDPRFELTAETFAEMYFRVWVETTQPFVATLHGNRMRFQSETGEWIDGRIAAPSTGMPVRYWMPSDTETRV